MPYSPISPDRIGVRKVTVDSASVLRRLDRFVADQTEGVPPSAIQRWLRTGQIRVNGRRARGNQRLQIDDEVRLPPYQPFTPDPGEAPVVPATVIREVAQRICYRDASLLILDKPAGMASHGGTGHEWGAVDAVRQLLAMEGATERPELCHRLDKETSGGLIFALQPVAVRQITELLRQGRVKKEYLALVQGIPRRMRGVIEQPLVKGAVRGGERMVITESEGMDARTSYRVVTRLGSAALLVLQPDTGRTHQIRVHLTWLGHPLAGDEKYGDRTFNQQMRQFGLNRMFLHASSLAFTHPATGQLLEVAIPLDPRLDAVVQRLARDSVPSTTGGG